VRCQPSCTVFTCRHPPPNVTRGEPSTNAAVATPNVCPPRTACSQGGGGLGQARGRHAARRHANSVPKSSAVACVCRGSAELPPCLLRGRQRPRQACRAAPRPLPLFMSERVCCPRLLLKAAAEGRCVLCVPPRGKECLAERAGASGGTVTMRTRCSGRRTMAAKDRWWCYNRCREE